jgi:hypothetical protein
MDRSAAAPLAAVVQVSPASCAQARNRSGRQQVAVGMRGAHLPRQRGIVELRRVGKRVAADHGRVIQAQRRGDHRIRPGAVVRGEDLQHARPRRAEQQVAQRAAMGGDDVARFAKRRDLVGEGKLARHDAFEAKRAQHVEHRVLVGDATAGDIGARDQQPARRAARRNVEHGAHPGNRPRRAPMRRVAQLLAVGADHQAPDAQPCRRLRAVPALPQPKARGDVVLILRRERRSEHGDARQVAAGVEIDQDARGMVEQEMADVRRRMLVVQHHGLVDLGFRDFHSAAARLLQLAPQPHRHGAHRQIGVRLALRVEHGDRIAPDIDRGVLDLRDMHGRAVPAPAQFGQRVGHRAIASPVLRRAMLRRENKPVAPCAPRWRQVRPRGGAEGGAALFVHDRALRMEQHLPFHQHGRRVGKPPRLEMLQKAQARRLEPVAAGIELQCQRRHHQAGIGAAKPFVHVRHAHQDPVFRAARQAVPARLEQPRAGGPVIRARVPLDRAQQRIAGVMRGDDRLGLVGDRLGKRKDAPRERDGAGQHRVQPTFECRRFGQALMAEEIGMQPAMRVGQRRVVRLHLDGKPVQHQRRIKPADAGIETPGLRGQPRVSPERQAMKAGFEQPRGAHVLVKSGRRGNDIGHRARLIGGRKDVAQLHAEQVGAVRGVHEVSRSSSGWRYRLRPLC